MPISIIRRFPKLGDTVAGYPKISTLPKPPSFLSPRERWYLHPTVATVENLLQAT